MKKVYLISLSVFLFIVLSCDVGGNGGVTPDHLAIISVISTPTDSESVTIKNYTSETIDLTTWTLGDLNDPVAYNIPNNTFIAPDEEKTYGHTVLGFGINDDNETIFLKNNGVTIDTWSY